MTHTLKLKSISPVTHDTHHLVLEKPEGFDFTPGQAVDFALDQDGWREEKRPFTFTSLPGDPDLEFVIKSYPDHDGVTEQIAKLQAGDTVLIDDPWGAIEDKGPGWFIAGGAGVTPFIAVLKKRLAEGGTLDGCTLIFANKTERDIILRDTFEGMSGLKTVFLVEDGGGQGVQTGRIDKDVLGAHVTPGQGKCYICGPDPMIEAVQEDLEGLGVTKDDIVTEEFD
ncbi:FAD-binding oxidoreductase [Thalassococcus sp. BH17M4-6]|uniref:FAD-binding oxidoreductase n=1 Tax=Thalassococcus sp. BH17M4-6 TaxID=3413148 RepID=UPI003BDCFF88